MIKGHWTACMGNKVQLQGWWHGVIRVFLPCVIHQLSIKTTQMFYSVEFCFLTVQGTLRGTGETWLLNLIRQECINILITAQLDVKTLGEGKRRGWASPSKEKEDRDDGKAERSDG